METEEAIALAVGALVVGYSYATIRAAKKIIVQRARYNHKLEIAHMKLDAQSQFVCDIYEGVPRREALDKVLAAQEFIDLIEKSI